MPLPVPQEFLEDALATWERLRQWKEMNNYLCALRSSPFYRHPPSERDPYSLRLARRVTEVVDGLEARVDMAVEDDITPRGALLALAEDVRLSLSPLPVSPPREWGMSYVSPSYTFTPTSTPTPTTDSVATASFLRDVWDAAIKRRSVSGMMMMEGLHVLTCPGVQLRIEMAIARLRRKVKEELVGGMNWEAFPHSPTELHALQATTMLLDDFEACYRSILATFPCARAMGSSHVPVALLPVIYEQYYQIGQWVLETEFTAREKPGAYVQAFDPKRMRAMILRSDKTSSWGLRFSNSGKLIGISAVVRSASNAGQRLHQFIESTKGGLTILTYNLKPVDLTNCDAEQVREKLDKLSRKQKRIYLSLKMDSNIKPSVEQLAFYATQTKQQQQKEQQEGLSGATLVLHRDHCNISWDMAITRDLIVMSVPVNSLSPEAKTFFSKHPKQVRIKGINGVEVTSAVQLEALSSTVNTIVLDLCTIPPVFPQGIEEGGKGMKEQTVTKASFNTNNACNREFPAESTKAALAPTETQYVIEVEQKKKIESTLVDVTGDDTTRAEDNSARSVRSKSAKATLASTTQDETSLKSSSLLKRKGRKENEEKNVATRKETRKYELRGSDILALKEAPLVSILERNLGKNFTPDNSTLPEKGNDMTDMTMKNGRYVKNILTDSPTNTRSWNDFTPSIDGDRIESAVSSAEVDYGTSSSPPLKVDDPPVDVSADAAVDVGPIKFPNNVTLDLLTLDEMVISRQSADKKWGLSMEAVGLEPNKTIRVTGLPLTTDKRLKQHPFHKLFNTYKGNWRVLSVNGTSATRLPEVMDVMKHALRMQIKFQKKW